MIQLEMFSDQLHLCRIDPAANMARFYQMVVQRDLFGGATLTREWGRIGSPGTIKEDHFPDEGQAIDALAELAKVGSIGIKVRRVP
jgi:predicted DNA-binding WGR domain protein